MKEGEQLPEMALPIAESELEKRSTALAKEAQSNSTTDVHEGGHDTEKEKSRAGQNGEDVDDAEEIAERERRRVEARAQALTLEMIGDLPSAEVKPPENVLFVCKLNPVTQDDDLELIFSRFGKIISCEVIRDKRTKESLQYAFIEFENQKDCEQAYFKMDKVLIDDHRIHVDFSQSVSKLSDKWRTVTNSKRAKQSGGFGGVAGLEKKRQYRDVDYRENRSGRHKMVFDKDDIRRSDKYYESKRSERPVSRSASPKREPSRSKDDGRNSEWRRSKSRERQGERHRGRDRRR